MPFGLANAPAVCQRFKNDLAREINDKISSSIEEGLQILEELLNKIRDYGG